MAVEVKLPELGENIEKGDVARVLVAVGDTVQKDQPIMELETDKATIEVPSPATGRVTDVRVKAGEQAAVGQVVIVVDETAAGGAEQAPAPAKAEEAPAAAAPAGASARGEAPAEEAEDLRDVEQAEANTRAAVEGDIEPSRPAPVVDIARGRQAAQPQTTPPRAPAALVPAAPSTRRYARELGVDITEVPGTGPGGRIGQADVKEHVKSLLAGGRRPSAQPLPDFSRWGGIDVQPMSNIRRTTAERLSSAWESVPHVTQFDKADVTELEAFRSRFASRVEKAGGKLTVTAILLKVVALALERFPQFASSVDMANQAIIYKRYCHVGIAVDTPNGLLVPVIRDVDRKTITELAVELATVSQKARDRKLSLDDMSGGVFTISNLGGIGGTAFTPIVNAPEVAILGVSRGTIEPVWRDGEFVPRQVLPLSLSYDHRVIDGADGARFLRFIAEALEQPLAIFL
ncbi:MAG: 2-oxo acid dehydrogenase subunit E2 [Acidobacteriota bacterium]|jgi:pyruvate dehydrogenase E2 component (dihydrolipoamide acetyltransferase)|nr:MAG: branched-chain alpha-keto acid dehydrogenase subunit E2 [Acidobacteriota bacterium]